MEALDQAHGLRILILEDSKIDVALILEEIHQGGLFPTTKQVDTLQGYAQALETERWDVILCDYNMPAFNALEALKLLQDMGLDIPFIVVSGSFGEDIAVQALKHGANDYLMKENLKRLVPSIEREVRDASERRANQHVKEILLETENSYYRLVDAVKDYGILMLNNQGHVMSWNKGAKRITGYNTHEIIGCHLQKFFSPEDRQLIAPDMMLRHVLTTDRYESEAVCRRKNGECFYANLVLNSVRNPQNQLIGYSMVIQDISQRKRSDLELNKRLHQLEVVASFGQRALDGIDNIKEVINEALILIAETLNISWVGLFEMVDDHATLQLKSCYGSPRPNAFKEKRIPTRRNTMAWHALQNREAVIVEIFQSNLDVQPTVPWEEFKPLSGMGIAVQGSSVPFGVIEGYTTQPMVFSKDDAHFSQSIANLLALAIERKRVEVPILPVAKPNLVLLPQTSKFEKE